MKLLTAVIIVLQIYHYIRRGKVNSSSINYNDSLNKKKENRMLDLNVNSTSLNNNESLKKQSIKRKYKLYISK